MENVEVDPTEKLVKGALVVLSIETSLGARYVFPDMDGQEATHLVRGFDRALSLSQLTLVNVTGACLALPTRVVEAVRVLQTEDCWPPVLEWVRPR